MKKLILSITTLLLATSSATFAQNADYKLGLGFYGGLSDYHGELNQSWFNFEENGFNAHAGVNAMYYINPSFNAGVDMSYGSIGHHVPEGNGLRANLFQANAQLRYKFNNGYILKEDAIIQPYIAAGTGVADWRIKDRKLVEPGQDWVGNLGAGFNVKLTERVALNYNLLYAYTNSDNRDGISAGTFNDQYMLHSAGVVFSLGKGKDTDRDGVRDRYDNCPYTPREAKVDANGCAIDSDNDGVADYLDACPNTKGSKLAEGCPDADLDGVYDSQDACPNKVGTKEMNGCPDTDNDGINDADDACPTRAGTDGNGCPTLEENSAEFYRLLNEVEFDLDKATLRISSHKSLDRIAELMKENEDFDLIIEGHADAQGSEEYNEELSKERAMEVKDYLTRKGVESNRIYTIAFGEELPQASNDTESGRQENRRVEFVVKF